MKIISNLKPKLFYGVDEMGFLDWLVRLEPFISGEHRCPMSANQFYWGARIQYGCALRLTELLNLTKADFDLNHRILTIKNSDTIKGDIQKTTILPYDAAKIVRFLSRFNMNEKLFPITKKTMLRYYRNALILGGFNLLEKDKINIDDPWNQLMRSSCAKMYEDLGAKFSIVQRKLRHSSSIEHKYAESDLQQVLNFEDKKLEKIPISNKS